MDLISICVYMVIGILGVAYPILFQVVAGLDQKYNSTIIVALFKSEPLPKWFRFFLVTSVIACFVWALKLQPLFGLNFWLINNSAIILVTISTGILISHFLHLVQLVLTYYSIVDFFSYLQRKSKGFEKKGNLDYFNAIADLFHFAVQQENLGICISMSDYFYGKFKQIRDNYQGRPVEYPFSYLGLVYRTIEQLCEKKNSQFQFLTERTAGAVWLLGETDYSEISQSTFQAIWRNLRLSLRYNRFDFIFIYWKWASQYYKYQLSLVPEQYDDQDALINAAEVDKRKKERQDFIEFECLLGALLLQLKDYKGLKRLFSFTTSLPPVFVLLPSGMGEIFSLFFYFSGSFASMLNIAGRFPFPDVDGAFSDEIIVSKVRDYIAVLFLRLYLLDRNSMYYDPLAPPAFPTAYETRVHWMSRMDLFISHVENIRKRTELLRELNISAVNEEFCKEKNVLPPVEYLEHYNSLLQQQTNRDILTQKISDRKYAAFLDKSREILTSTLTKYTVLNNLNLEINEPVTINIQGKRIPIERSAFGEMGELSTVNHDGFLATEVANSFQGSVLYAFSTRSTDRFLLDAKQIIPALHRMSLDQADVVIAFGIKLTEVAVVNRQSLEGIVPLEFSSGSSEQLNNSVFVIKRNQLPKFVFGPPSKELDLFASISDLRNRPDLQVLLTGYSAASLINQVLVAIHLNCTMIFEKVTKIVRIQATTRLMNRGIPSSLDDVKKF